MVSRPHPITLTLSLVPIVLLVIPATRSVGVWVAVLMGFLFTFRWIRRRNRRSANILIMEAYRSDDPAADAAAALPVTAEFLEVWLRPAGVTGSSTEAAKAWAEANHDRIDATTLAGRTYAAGAIVAALLESGDALSLDDAAWAQFRDEFGRDLGVRFRKGTSGVFEITAVSMDYLDDIRTNHSGMTLPAPAVGVNFEWVPEVVAYNAACALLTRQTVRDAAGICRLAQDHLQREDTAPNAENVD